MKNNKKKLAVFAAAMFAAPAAVPADPTLVTPGDPASVSPAEPAPLASPESEPTPVDAGVAESVADPAPADPLPPGSVPAGWQTEARVGTGLFAEGERDLGLGLAKETTEGFADVQGTVYWNSGDNWAALTRAQLFAPTGELVVTDEDQPRDSKSFARLREAWVEYRGLTSYPGESMRVGLQRLRDPDGQWFDQNIEAVRWMFDTTLLQADVGAAESFLTWRSDGSDPRSNVRDRTYVFGRLGTQWKQSQFVGARAIHAFDHADPEEEVLSDERDPKLADRNLTWIDVYAHNGYYDSNGKPGVSYWADFSALVGDRKDYTPSTDPLTPATTEKSDVRAWATDVGLRWRLPTTFPLQIGGNYAFGSGSEDGDTEHRYEQTGLHSNQSRFTGTRTQVYRYNGALQAELTNLHVGTVYVSIPHDRWDASLIYSKFARQHAGDPIVADGLSIQPEPGRKSLGDGVDLALAYYFANPVGRGRSTVTATQEDDNLRSNIRLRASAFDPDAAFPDEADPKYLVRLELTLWF